MTSMFAKTKRFVVKSLIPSRSSPPKKGRRRPRSAQHPSNKSHEWVGGEVGGEGTSWNPSFPPIEDIQLSQNDSNHQSKMSSSSSSVWPSIVGASSSSSSSSVSQSTETGPVLRRPLRWVGASAESPVRMDDDDEAPTILGHTDDEDDDILL